MKLRAALKQHQGSSATNRSSTLTIRVVQLWSYRSGRWQTSYQVTGLHTSSGVVLWQQVCDDLDEVEHSLKTRFPEPTAHALDDTAWT